MWSQETTTWTSLYRNAWRNTRVDNIWPRNNHGAYDSEYDCERAHTNTYYITNGIIKLTIDHTHVSLMWSLDVCASTSASSRTRVPFRDLAASRPLCWPAGRVCQLCVPTGCDRWDTETSMCATQTATKENIREEECSGVPPAVCNEDLMTHQTCDVHESDRKNTDGTMIMTSFYHVNPVDGTISPVSDRP